MSYDKCKRSLQRIKRGILPKNPLTCEDINIAFADEKVFSSYGRSLHVEENFIFFDGAVDATNYSFCVFSSKKTIALVQENFKPEEIEILMDATFRIVPVGPFKQLLILYFRVHKKVCTFFSIYLLIPKL